MSGEGACPIGGGMAPNTNPSVKGLGFGGLPMKKKLMPKKEPKTLREKSNWKKSFGVYKTAQNPSRGKHK